MLNLLFTLAALAAPVPQATAGPAPSVQVRHSDLNLALARDRAIFDRRIARAIDKLCPTAQIGQTTPSLAGLRCRRETLARLTPERNRAVAQASAPVLLSASAR